MALFIKSGVKGAASVQDFEQKYRGQTTKLCKTLIISKNLNSKLEFRKKTEMKDLLMI